MPVDLKTALADHRLTQTESDELLKEAKPEDVDVIVDEMAVDALDLSTAEATKVANDFLGGLDKLKPLPVDRKKAERPDGTMDWVSALRVQQAGDALKTTGFSGEALGVDGKGRLLSAGHRVDVASMDDTALNALLGAAKPGQLDALPQASKTRFFDALLTQVDDALPIAAGSAGKFRKTVTATAAFATLAANAKALTSGQVDKLLALFADMPTPLGQALIGRALDGATLSPAQQAARAALTPVAVGPDLLAAFDRSVSKSGAPAALDIVALAFSKDTTAITNFQNALSAYGNVDGTWGLSDDEARAVLKDLEPYLDGSQQFQFIFGSFGDQAIVNAAKLSNARIAPTAIQALGVTLTPEQEAFVKTIVPGIKDEAALRSVADALKSAASLFGTLTPAAFELFRTQATRAFERKDDNKDHMIDAWGLSREVRGVTTQIATGLKPHLQSLAATPPTFDGIALTAGAAATLKTTLEAHLRSEMTTQNLGQALKVIADAHGGAIDAAGEAQLAQLIADYKKNWPGASVFDFNKLSRMAGFVVQGKAVPLCTVNGQQVSLGDFYGQVARSVAAAVDPKKVAYEWMPDRYGVRAAQSVELLDVIAQQTAEGKGPIVELQKAYPNKVITVRALCSDGAHEQFIFDVAGVGRFNQASDGTLAAYRSRMQNELFTAVVKNDGTFDVKVAQTLTPLGWPLQTSYAVGDFIDIRYADPKAAESTVEGKPFSNEHKVLQAKIESFDAAGHYTVSYKDPDGNVKQASLLLGEIEKMNNPHDFSLNGSEFSDVSIDVRKQPGLKQFIDGARPIIAKYLPPGAALTMSPQELAKAQRQCVGALQAYMHPLMTYPAEKEHADSVSAEYHKLIDGLGGWNTTPLEKLLALKRGVCRHQCIIEQLLMQVAGIDSRLASGAANTMSGDFRGFHIWNELSLADNARYLSDETWSDAIIPLWTGAYDTDKRRIEMYDRTARYDGQIV